MSRLTMVSLNLFQTALDAGFTPGDLTRISVRRERFSVTQGEAVVCVDGIEVIRFGDQIELSSGGIWRSVIQDDQFIIGALNHPFDDLYHYADRMRRALSR